MTRPLLMFMLEMQTVDGMNTHVDVDAPDDFQDGIPGMFAHLSLTL